MFCDFICFMVLDMCVKHYWYSFVFLLLASRSEIETSGEKAFGVEYWFNKLLMAIVRVLLRLCYFLNLISIQIRVPSDGQVEISSREDDQIIMMFASLRVRYDIMASGMPEVCEFLMYFPRTL